MASLPVRGFTTPEVKVVIPHHLDRDSHIYNVPVRYNSAPPSLSLRGKQGAYISWSYAGNSCRNIKGIIAPCRAVSALQQKGLHLRKRGKAPRKRERERTRNKNTNVLGYVDVYEHAHVHVSASTIKLLAGFASLPQVSQHVTQKSAPSGGYRRAALNHVCFGSTLYAELYGL